MKVAIIGLGYVGLPLAVAFAEEGNDVVCFDLDAKKTTALAEGRSYIEDIDDATLGAIKDRLHPTSRHADLATCDAIIICVPTPLTSAREPDLTYLLDAASSIAQVLQPEQLVVMLYDGARRFLYNIVQYPGCGSFFRPASPIF